MREANLEELSLPPDGAEPGPEGLVTGLRLLGEVLELNSGIKNPVIAIAPIMRPINGTNTITRIHLVALATVGAVFRKSILTCEMICAGRPRISSGTDSELLQ
jgi:hypothetical protein